MKKVFSLAAMTFFMIGFYACQNKVESGPSNPCQGPLDQESGPSNSRPGPLNRSARTRRRKRRTPKEKIEPHTRGDK